MKTLKDCHYLENRTRFAGQHGTTKETLGGSIPRPISKPKAQASLKTMRRNIVGREERLPFLKQLTTPQ